MQGDYPPEIERGKLAALTELFRKRIGYSPTSFRAGRFGIGHDTGRWLFELGYLVDSSVVPHVCLRNPAPVSYTHLDVYKRQISSDLQRRSGWLETRQPAVGSLPLSRSHRRRHAVDHRPRLHDHLPGRV